MLGFVLTTLNGCTFVNGLLNMERRNFRSLFVDCILSNKIDLDGTIFSKTPAPMILMSLLYTSLSASVIAF